MKISKEFRWEMGHRIPDHDGLCRNVHGHSYKMIVEVTGDILKNGMIIDFYDLELIVKPVIDELDHSFLCERSDEMMIEFLKVNRMKYFTSDFSSTVENICSYLAEIFLSKIDRIKYPNIKSLTIKIFETPNSFAEHTIMI